MFTAGLLALVGCLMAGFLVGMIWPAAGEMVAAYNALGIAP